MIGIVRVGGIVIDEERVPTQPAFYILHAWGANASVRPKVSEELKSFGWPASVAFDVNRDLRQTGPITSEWGRSILWVFVRQMPFEHDVDLWGN